MFNSYLKTAIRSLLRQKAFSAINILGLSVGMACSMLILQYVRYELTYDQQHLKSDNVYRVLRETQRPDGNSKFSPYLSGILGKAMEAEIPEVEETSRLSSFGGVTVTSGSRQIRASLSFADPTFFDIFDFKLIDGTDAGQALQQPGTILLMDMGRNIRPLFGDEDPVGKTVSINNGNIEGEYIVAGIMKDRTTNAVFRWDFITTHLSKKYPIRTWAEWDRNANMTQVVARLNEDSKINNIESKLNGLLNRNLGPEFSKTNSYHLQKFDRIRLYSEVDFGIPSHRNIQQLYFYGFIAFLVVAIACVNFINLTTARAGKRAREIGIRKVTGASFSQLIGQFLIESILITICAGGIAGGLAYLALPTFNQIAWGTTLSIEDLPWILLFSIFVGILAGIYPAIYLSRQEPVRVLKGMRDSGRPGRLRQGLVISQFAVSTLLVIGSLAVYLQLSYISNRQLGFDPHCLVSMDILRHGLKSKEDGERAKAAFLRNPNILAATRQGWRNLINTGEITVTSPDNGQQYSIYQFQTDADFIKTYQVNLKMGRNFLNDNPDSEFIINETAAKRFGWKNPIGQSLKIGRRQGTVVGVVDDFNFQSLYNSIQPLIIRNAGGTYLHLRIKETGISETIAFMEETWKQLAPNVPFSYQFVDDYIAGNYRDARQEAAISFFSTGMAVLVAFLGVLGLTANATIQRTKEISIRKVLGASAPNIVALFTKDLLGLIVLANVFAVPLAYYLTQNWLGQFAYRIALSPNIFVVGSISVTALVLLTSSSLALCAASANPIEALKSE